MTKKIVAALLFALLALTWSCTSRQIIETYKGSTTQRLMAKSIHRMVGAVPSEDLAIMKGAKVFVEYNFLEEMLPKNYVKRRFEVFLSEQGVKLAKDQAEAQILLVMFFTSLGSDRTETNLGTPEIPIPSPVGGGPIATVPKFSLYGADTYEGLAEVYYYIYDNREFSLLKAREGVLGKAYSNRYTVLFVFSFISDDI
jgi:hypothetical protein